MRLALLAINFFLLLTLANAVSYRKAAASLHHQSYTAAFQVPDGPALRYEREFVVYREVGAAVVTLVLFGAIVYYKDRLGVRRRSTRVASTRPSL